MKNITLAAAVFASLMFSSHFYDVFAETDGNEITKKAIENTPAYCGYKGRIIVKVIFFDEHYAGTEGFGDTAGKSYKAYLEKPCEGDARIKYHDNEGLDELELVFPYDKDSERGSYSSPLINGKRIWKDNMPVSENVKKLITQYPYAFSGYGAGLDFSLEPYLEMLADANGKKILPVSMMDKNHEKNIRNEYYYSETEDGSFFLIYDDGSDNRIDINSNFRVTAYHIEDFDVGYSWSKSAPKSYFSSFMDEGFEITFLEEQGWLK